jgi:diguanylate cyclase (GGDEF)-like protein/PAS domain S-box-containing protein
VRPSRSLLVASNDNSSSITSFVHRLEQEGYDVTLVADGFDAVERVVGGSYDLLLLDTAAANIGGVELLSRFRATYALTELPIIVLTPGNDSSDVAESLRLGANDYLAKPIDAAVALARIANHLAHRQAVKDLRESEERYTLAIRGASEGLWDWDLATNQVHYSSRWKAMLGYKQLEIGTSPDDWLTRVHPDDLPHVKKALAAHLARQTAYFESDHRIQHHDGTYRWVRSRGGAVSDATGTAIRLVGSLTDITDSKVADALTGLPNRLLFVDMLDRALKRTQRRDDYAFALLILGLDRFRAVNDSLGPLTADRLLVAIARRLQGCLRSTDAVAHQEYGVTLARLGGDEFTVLLDDIADTSDAVRVAERLRAALEKPFEIDGHQVFTSATVGIAVSTSGYERSEEILRDAAIALHRTKGSGTSSCELFDPAMRQHAVSRLQMETDLRNAVEVGAFEIHYQPIISLKTGLIAGFEALVRWRHPTRGLISPAEFIPVAEDTGMILHIGRLMLTGSCRQMAIWLERYGADAPGVICVNVSGRQFAQADLALDIEAILKETLLDAANLKLEVTESAFIGDVRAAEVTLGRVQAMGIEWSLDDFGTGYSSLSYLHRLQVDTLKVDRSFVSRIGDDGTEMVRAMVAMAHNLGMDVVAEGVETAEQFAQLHMLGCEFAQGFYFSKPVDAATADRLIATQPWRHVTRVQSVV